MIASTAASPDVLHGGQTEPNRMPAAASRTGVKLQSLALTSGGRTLMPISRHSLMYFTTFADVAGFRRQQRGHEIHRIVRLQIRRDECQERIGGRVRLVETVAGELLHQVEDLLDLLLPDGRAPRRP